MFTSGGVPIRVDVYPVAETGVYPSIIFLHGAEGMPLTPGNYNYIGNWFSARGFNFYIVRYFDSTGTTYGTPLVASRNFGTWLTVVNDAATWVLSLPGVDPNRVSLMGMSLGGTLSVSAANADARISALAVWYAGEATWYTKNHAGAEITHLPPTIIIHGQDDLVSPVANAFALQSLLQSMGVANEIYIYPNQGHVLNSANQDLALAQTRTFFQTYP